MSGLTGNNILAGSSGQGGYEIGQSLRFNGTDNSDLSRTPSSASNRRTWTWSGWVKRSDVSANNRTMFSSYIGQNDNFRIFFFTDYSLRITETVANVTKLVLNTTQLFRDVSAWYHIVVAVDTTQSTASDRMKIYINGSQVIDFSASSYPSLNYETMINDTVAHFVGNQSAGDGRDIDGYLAEVNFVDGQALDASNFGETDLLTNQWIPKKYVSTYGTNGFYLNFGNSASLGADSSGNGNNFTPTNLAATDQVLDSPTNNFSTFNPLWFRTSNIPTYKEGNLQVSPSSASQQPSISSFGGLKSGKWYCEFYVQALTNAFYLGAIESSARMEYVASNTAIISRIYTSSNGNKQSYPSASSVAYGATYTTGDIIGIALDLDVGELTYYKNGVSQGVAFTDLLSAMPDSGWSFFIDHSQSSNIANVNFGQDSSFAGNKTAQNNTDANGKGDFYYAPPSGYLALCNFNLPDPSIALPGSYFETAIYTGNGTARKIPLGFQADFSWFKQRSHAVNHHLYDSVRGSAKYLQSNTTVAEADASVSGGGVTSWVSDGINLPADTFGDTNFTGRTYVSWNWKAGGTASSNTDGTITSTVSANPTAGFSIATYTGNGSTSSTTVGHGLSIAPNCVIVKRRDAVSDWIIGHDGLATNAFANNKFLKFNSSETFTNVVVWGSQPTSSVVQITNGSAANLNASGGTYVMYCFHEVEGYSKFGSYTGGGGSDGTFIYTGFTPAFVIFKRTDVAQGWYVMDNKRNLYNVMNNYLRPNAADAEGTAVNSIADYVSNGIKMRGSGNDINGGSASYIYMAFAESPFKTSNAR